MEIGDKIICKLNYNRITPIQDTPLCVEGEIYKIYDIIKTDDRYTICMKIEKTIAYFNNISSSENYIKKYFYTEDEYRSKKINSLK